MTTAQPRPLKPLPTPTKDNAPFWEGLKLHEFRLQQCKGCGAYRWLPKPACPECFSTDFEWVKASGEGTVWTFTVVCRTVPAFDPPFVAAAIELKERPRKCLVLSHVVNCAPEQVRIGMPVKMIFEDVPGEDITLYKFVPAEQTTTSHRLSGFG